MTIKSCCHRNACDVRFACSKLLVLTSL